MAEREPRQWRGGAEMVLLACVLVGAILRVGGIFWQLPMDDEWHGLDFALTRDFWFLLTHFSRAGANSIPFNLYLRGALVTVGWTEVTIVLPSLLAGVGLLWVFPRWVLRRFGFEAALVSAALLAISPFLVFYSRMARVYSVVLLLECLALLGLLEWLRTGKRRHGVALVCFGALAIWSHASALAPMLAAVAVAIMHRALLVRRASEPVALSLRPLVTAGLAMLALAGALWLPGLLAPLPSPIHPAARFSFRTFASLAELVGGNAHLSLQLLLALAAVAGVWLLARSALEIVLVLAAAVGGGLFVVLVARPNLAGVGLVLARYLLPAFLLGSLAVGVAVQAVVRRAGSVLGRNLRLGAVFASIALLYFLGPLPRIHGAVNSFTKHPAMQASYAEPDPERALPDPLDDGVSVPVRRSELQPFYARLAQEAGRAPIIEYPFLLGEDANLLYFSQQVHQRPVLGGYYGSGAEDKDVFGLAVGASTPEARARVSPGYIVNAMMVDHVFGRHRTDDRVRFRTLVDILDPIAVERSGAEYLILHGNVLRELFGVGPAGVRSRFVAQIRDQMVTRYGAPVFENALVTVLRVPGVRSPE